MLQTGRFPQTLYHCLAMQLTAYELIHLGLLPPHGAWGARGTGTNLKLNAARWVTNNDVLYLYQEFHIFSQHPWNSNRLTTSYQTKT